MALTAGSMSVSGSAQITEVTIAPQGTASTTVIPAPTAGAGVAVSQSLEYGTGSGQADIYCAGNFTLGAGLTVTWDLYTGTDFKDLFGETAAFRKLKSITVAVLSGGDASGLVVGNAASDAASLFFGANTQTWTVYPSGPPLFGGSPAGVTVDATHKNLKIANAGAAEITFAVALAGTSV